MVSGTYSARVGHLEEFEIAAPVSPKQAGSQLQVEFHPERRHSGVVNGSLNTACPGKRSGFLRRFRGSLASTPLPSL